MAAASTTPKPLNSQPASKIERIDEDKVKFDAGGCETLRVASIKCLEDIGYDRAAAASSCKLHFDAYKECRRQENAAKQKQRAETGLFGGWR